MFLRLVLFLLPLFSTLQKQPWKMCFYVPHFPCKGRLAVQREELKRQTVPKLFAVEVEGWVCFCWWWCRGITSHDPMPASGNKSKHLLMIAASSLDFLVNLSSLVSLLSQVIYVWGSYFCESFEEIQCC